jgi:hypothetical protein
VRAAGGSDRDRPAGTFEHTDRASDLLRRESEYCCRNMSGLLRRESEWCQKEKTETSNNNVRLRCEKKGDPGWQSKETNPKTRDASNWVASKGGISYNHASPVRNYR